MKNKFINSIFQQNRVVVLFVVSFFISFTIFTGFFKKTAEAQTGNTITLDKNTTYQTFTGWEATGFIGEPGFAPYSVSWPYYKNSLLNQAVNDYGINRIRLEVVTALENPIDLYAKYLANPNDTTQWNWVHVDAAKFDNDDTDPNSVANWITNNPNNPNIPGFTFHFLDEKITNYVLDLKQLVEAKQEQFQINLTYVGFHTLNNLELFTNPSEYAEYMLAIFQHMKVKYGLVPNTIEVELEPDNTGFDGIKMGKAINATKTLLSSKGFNPKFVIPCTTDMNKAVSYFNDILGQIGDASMRQNVAEFCYHRYLNNSDTTATSIASKADQYGIGAAMLEWWVSQNDYQQLYKELTLAKNTAWQQDAILAMYLVNTTNPTNPIVSPNNKTKYIQQFTRYIRPEALRIGHTLSSGFPVNLKPVVFINKDGKYVVATITNQSGLSFSIAELPAGTYGITYTIGTGANQWNQSLPDQTISTGQSLSTTSQGVGVMTIFQKTGGTPLPTSTPIPPSPTPQPCVITTASWITPAALPLTEGQQVSLKVNSTGSSSGQQISFKVRENDSIFEGGIDDDAKVQPANATFVGNTATGTWTAEWENDCSGLCLPPEYFFNATSVSSGQTLRSLDPLLTTFQATGPPPTPTPIPANQIYWGAWIDGSTYGLPNDSPWDLILSGGDTTTRFENTLGKRVSIIHYGLPFKNNTGAFNSFSTQAMDAIRNHGSIPLLDWSTTQSGGGVAQPAFSNGAVTNGTYDSYITTFAQAAKTWGHPFFLRFDWEMNGNWFNWSDGVNGNAADSYVAMWKHVRDIFTSQGATNVTWIWCPNTVYSGSTPLTQLYPGDAYVDWTCMDGYNWSSDKASAWFTPNQLFAPTYTQLTSLAPNKPIMIGETGTSKDGGSKPNWITDLLTTQLPTNFPKIKALVWFNWDDRTSNLDWPVEGNGNDVRAGIIDQASITAFKNAVASSFYATNSFSTYNTSPIAPIVITSPTAAPTIAPTNTPAPLPTIPPPTLTPSSIPIPIGTTYYISPTGNDVNSGLSTALPWKTFPKAWTAMMPGDRLLLMDGTYTAVNNPNVSKPTMPDPAIIYPTIHGDPGKYITIKALNDGKAIIDGEHRIYGWRPFIPVKLGEYLNFDPRATFFIVEGLVAKDSSGDVFKIVAKNVILRRNSGYNAYSESNNSVFSVYAGGDASTPVNILLEDNVAAGTGRKMFLAYITQNNLVLRRNFAAWQYWQGGKSLDPVNRPTDIYCGSPWPQVDAVEIYPERQGNQPNLPKNTIMENNISFGLATNQGISLSPNAGERYGNYVLGNIALGSGMRWDQSQAVFKATRANGAPIYDSSNSVCNFNEMIMPVSCQNLQPRPTCQIASDQASRQGISVGPFESPLFINTQIKDNLAAFNGTFGFTAGPFQSGSYGNVLANNTFVNNGIGDPAPAYASVNASNYDTTIGDLSQFDSKSNLKIGLLWNSVFPYSPPPVTNPYTGAGATIQNRYLDGQLTSQPLWPWPMEERIKREFADPSLFQADGVQGRVWNNFSVTQEVCERVLKPSGAATDCTAGSAPTPTPIPGACSLTSASWNSLTATQGQTVGLNVTATGTSCANTSVHFEVRRNGLTIDDIPANIQPADIPLNGTSASTTWVAEYNPLIPLTDPQYYFKANIVGQTTTIGNKASLLTVNQATVTASPTPIPQPTPTTTPLPPPPGSPTPTLPPGSTVTITSQLSQSTDDVNQDGTGLDPVYGSNHPELYFGTGANDPTSSYTGLRFRNINIPKGAQITNATLSINADSWGGSVPLSIWGDNTGNSLTFSPSSVPGGRPSTNSQITYTDNASAAKDAWYDLPSDLSPVISEIVNRSDWQSGNSLSLIVKGLSTNTYSRKFAWGFDHGAGTAPKLNITYSTGANLTPTGTPPLASPSSAPSPTPVPSACNITTASWGATTVQEGNTIGLNIQATGGCSGKSVNLAVRKNISLLPDEPAVNQSVPNPVPLTLYGSVYTAGASWLADAWANACLVGTCDPQYFFKANLVGTTTTVESNPRLISVTKAGSTTGLTISNVSTNASSYPNSQIPKYEKFEATFNVAGSVGTNFQMPYDPTPPAGIDQKGISVTGIFTSPLGKVYEQPAFYSQLFDDQTKSGQEWLYPIGGQSIWRIRFSPHETGTWKFRITGLDGGGSGQSEEQTFNVTNSSSKGFVKVSPNDSRYFQFDDGTYFPALGVNYTFSSNEPSRNAAEMAKLSQNGVTLLRKWITPWSIWGNVWSPWLAMNRPYDPGSYLPHNLLITNGASSTSTTPSSNLALVYSEQNGVQNTGSWFDACVGTANNIQPIAAVKQGSTPTTYHVKVRYKATDLTGPRDTNYPNYGFTVKMQNPNDGNWHTSCYNAGEPTNGVVLKNNGTPVYGGNSDAWTFYDADWTNTQNLDFLPMMYLALENANGLNAATGKKPYVYIDKVEMREKNPDGTLGPNILLAPSMEPLTYMKERNAYALDKLLDLAHQNNIYLKTVIMEHNDSTENEIGFDGNVSPWDPGVDGKNKFYGNYRTMTAVRWYQQAWWRYLQARYGYSPNIFAWEAVNEADPSYTNHYGQVDEMGKFLHCVVAGIPVATGTGTDSVKCPSVGPNSHLVSTSFSGGFETNLFASTKYPNVDFADIHKYIPKDVTSPPYFSDTALSTYDLSMTYGAKQQSGAGKPVFRGETGLTNNASNTNSVTSDVYADTNGVWLHNLIWGGINSGGLLESYWYVGDHIYPGNTSNPVDHLSKYKTYYDFIKNIPLNNGNYVDIGAAVSDTNLRAWGQKDTVNGNAHLWIANKNHTWQNVVNGVTITPITTTVTISGMPAGTYQASWWDTYAGTPTTGPASSYTVGSDGNLTVSLTNLSTDIAVKLSISTVPTVAPTSTPVPTSTLIPTSSPTPTKTPTPTPTLTPTTTNSPTPIPTFTPTPTNTPTPTKTPTPLPTNTPTPTSSPTPLPTSTPIPTRTPTPTKTPIPTNTSTPQPTNTPLPTATTIPTPTSAPSTIPTPTNVVTLTQIPTAVSSPTETNTPVPTSTAIPTLTPSPTPTPSPILGNGDVNLDGKVDETDSAIVIREMLGAAELPFDQYGDGFVNSLDFAVVTNNYPIPTAAITPTITSSSPTGTPLPTTTTPSIILSSTPPPAAAPIERNYLTNFGFESGLTGWTRVSGFSAVVVSGISHSGTKSLQLTQSNFSDQIVIQNIPIVAGRTYSLSGWLRTSSITRGEATISLVWLKPSVKPNRILTLRQDTFARSTGTKPWTLYNSSLIAPTGATLLRITLRLSKGTVRGRAWYDDLALQ